MNDRQQALGPGCITLDDYLETLTPEAREAINVRYEKLLQTRAIRKLRLATYDEAYAERRRRWKKRYKVPTKHLTRMVMDLRKKQVSIKHPTPAETGMTNKRVPMSYADYDDLAHYFGYPPCCEADFIRRRERCEQLTPERREQLPEEFKGTGFVPCVACVETLSPQAILDYINRNRSCPEPFPTFDRFTEETIAVFRKWQENKPPREVLRRRYGP